MHLSKIDNLPLQGGLEWHRARLGHISGSNVGKLMTTSRKKDEVFGETAKSYLYKVASERCLNENVVDDDYELAEYLDLTSPSSRAMQWGSEQESPARKAYEEREGVEVMETGFIEHPDIPLFGASPDGVILAADKVVEIKSPLPATAFMYAATIYDAATLKAVNPDYYWQVVSEIECCGAQSADFCVWCPFFDGTMSLHVAEIVPPQEDFERLRERVLQANNFIENEIVNIKVEWKLQEQS